MHLILSQPGTILRVKHGQLQVVRGKEVLHQIPPEKLRSITISGGITITSDALFLALNNGIEILLVDGKGIPQGRLWSIAYGSISTIRKNQVAFFYSQDVIGWVKELLTEKIRKSTALLETFVEDLASSEQEEIRRIQRALLDYVQKIQAVPEDVPWHEAYAELRGWEGQAARKYFQGIQRIVPPPWTPQGRTRHPPRDPFNAVLSYAYGILYVRVEGALIRAGLDPYVGIYHRDEYQRPALVYDFMEKYRHWMDYVSISLARAGALSEDFFIREPDTGACWLEGLGKRIVAQAVVDYLSEIVTIRGVRRSREEHIFRDAQSFAQFLQKWQPS